jgi:hypothetical protein
MESDWAEIKSKTPFARVRGFQNTNSSSLNCFEIEKRSDFFRSVEVWSNNMPLFLKIWIFPPHFDLSMMNHFLPNWTICRDFDHPRLRTIIVYAAIMAKSNWIMGKFGLTITEIITKPSSILLIILLIIFIRLRKWDFDDSKILNIPSAFERRG